MSKKTTKVPNLWSQIVNRQLGYYSNVDFRINLFSERLKKSKNLYNFNLVSHFGCVNSIEFSREGKYLVSGGDDRRVLLWHMEKAMADKQVPPVMEKQHQSNIFCLGFNSDNTRIFSGGNDDTVIVHDIKTTEAIDVFLHAKPVYGLSVNPTNDNLFASAGEDGRVLVFDLRLSAEVMCVARYYGPFHAVMYHPLQSHYVITANGKEGSGFWDIRKPKNPLLRYGGENAAQNCMSVRFNTMGTSVLALRRRLPPILYSTFSETPICQFYHPDYYNSCTMKSCCFAGEKDEYILSGSDDFNLYVWKIEDADLNKTGQLIHTNHMVLYGHRSIVNQVRYNSQKCIIASSGVEKIIKLWTPFALDGWSGSLVDETTGPDNPREVYSHDEYLSLMNISNPNMSHDYSNQNTTEDPRMMAFFDSLVQQEIEAWNTTASSDSDQSTQHSSDNSSRPTSIQSSESEIELPLRNLCHRATSNNHTYKPQRTKYPHRIAYLIATKRNTLKRLALKGATQASKRIRSSTFGSRKTKRNNSLRTIRKVPNSKRSGRYNSKKTHRRPSSREQNSDSEVTTNKVTKRRIQQHLNSLSYRSTFRRKTKSNVTSAFYTYSRAEASDSSSDDEIPRATKQKQTTTEYMNDSIDYNSLSPPVTVKNDNNIIEENYDVITAVPQPSTSTGIRENNSGLLFRITQQQQDTDDDQSLQNSPIGHSINYNKRNGTINNETNCHTTTNTTTNNSTTNNFYNNININNLSNNEDGDDDDEKEKEDDEEEEEDIPTEYCNKSPKRNRHNYINTDIYSSHSNSRLSNSSYQDDNCTSNDSLPEYFIKRRKLNNNNKVNINGNDNSGVVVPILLQNFNSILEDDDDGTTATEDLLLLQNREKFNYTPDSGINVTAACSSSGSTISPFCNINDKMNNKNNNNGSINNNNNNDKSSIKTSISSSSSTTTTTALPPVTSNTSTTDGNNNYSLKIFQQKISRVRRNYRKKFQDDSDSD